MISTAGRLLREARETRGMSQAELAAHLYTRQSAISRVECGRASPTWLWLELAFKALDYELRLAAVPRNVQQREEAPGREPPLVR